jgi:rsbT co-antagonist protein RsbR
MSDDERFSDAQRIERLVEVLDFLSAGIFVESMVSVEVTERDDLAALEGRMSAFSKEFIRATLESDRRLDVIREQNEAIGQLSSPILDIWDGVVLVPIIGTLDEARAAKLLPLLLSAIIQSSARAVILDLTGVDASGADAVEPLHRMIEATRLMGCRAVVSGIRPELAAHLAASRTGIAGARIAGRLKDALRMSIGEVTNRRTP